MDIEEEERRNHYGEIVAIDQSIGNLRRTLREMGIEKNTIIWFNSDNGGLSDFWPVTTGGLRGYKPSLYEGGIRVPGIIEWPNGITKSRVTQFPASTLDIFPTLADIVGIPKSLMLEPQDGISLTKLFAAEIERRDKPIPFRYQGSAALIDNEFKLIVSDYQQGEYELYDLSQDPQEIRNLMNELPNVARSLRTTFEAWNQTVESSVAGKDYPEGKLTQPDRKAVRWTSMPEYKSYLATWGQRPEYKQFVEYVRLKFTRRITRWSLRLVFLMGIVLVIWLWRRKPSAL